MSYPALYFLKQHHNAGIIALILQMNKTEPQKNTLKNYQSNTACKRPPGFELKSVGPQINIISRVLFCYHLLISAAQGSISSHPSQPDHGLALNGATLTSYVCQMSVSKKVALTPKQWVTCWEKKRHQERTEDFREACPAIGCRFSVILPALNSFLIDPFIVIKGSQGLVCSMPIFSHAQPITT